MSGTSSDIVCRIPRITESSPQKPTEALWTYYQDHLRDIFIVQDKSVVQVRSHMLETHCFEASLQQYHRTFRKWGFQKNMRSEEWHEISKAVKRRHLDIDHAEVWYNGDLMPRKRLKKELPRYDRPTLQSKFILSNPELASKEVVPSATRASSPAGGILVRVALDPSISILPPARLPWFSFVDTIKEKVRVLKSLDRPSLASPGNSDPHVASSLNISDVARQIGKSEPSVQYGLVARDRHLKSFLELESVFPERQSGELFNSVKALTQHNTTAAYTSLVSHAAYLFANNLGVTARWQDSAEASIVKGMVRWVTSMPEMGVVFLEQLRAIGSSVARSVIDKLLYIAIDDCNLELFEVMVRVGIDLDRALNEPRFGACTPLQLSLLKAKNSSVLSITKRLLEAGANPNFCGKHGQNKKSAATYCCGLFPLDQAIQTQSGAAIDALVEHGSYMYSTCNLTDVLSSDISLVLAMVFLKIVDNAEQANPNLDQPSYLGSEGRVPERYLCPLQASCASGSVEMTSLLLERGADPNGISTRELAVWFPNERYNVEDSRQVILYQAISRGLIHMESPLTSAVANGQSEIMRMLLKAGANVNRCLWSDLIDFWANTDPLHPSIESSLWSKWINFKSVDVGIPCRLFLRDFGKSSVATPLQAACVRIDNDMALDLLRLGANPNPVCGTPPLAVAAMTGNKELVLRLLRHGARPNYCTCLANTLDCNPLTAATLECSTEIMEILVNAGAHIDSDGHTGKSPLSRMLLRAHRIGGGDFSAAQQLVLLGAGVNHPSVFPEAVKSTVSFNFILETGLFRWEDHTTEALDLGFKVAVAMQNYLIAETILQRAKYLHSEQGKQYRFLVRSFPLELSSLFETDESVRLDAADWWLRYLLYHGDRYKAPLKHRPYIRWWSLSECGPVEGHDQMAFLRLIRCMISRGADLNASLCPQCLTPLSMATTRATDAVINVLISNGANSELGSAHHCLELGRAIVEDDLRMVEILLDHGTQVNAIIDFAELVDNCENTCFGLHEPVWQHRWLQNYVLDDDSSWILNCREITAFQLASILERDEVTKLLVVRGADVNVTAPSKGHGLTALQYACERGDLEMVNLLLNHGAEVNSPAGPDRGVTALQAAAIRGDFKIVQTLVAAGADVAAPASAIQGRTAIDGAAENGRLDIVAYLLDNYKNDIPLEELCESASQFARDEGHMNVVEFLASYQRERQREQQQGQEYTSFLQDGTYSFVEDVVEF